MLRGRNLGTKPNGRKITIMLFSRDGGFERDPSYLCAIGFKKRCMTSNTHGNALSEEEHFDINLMQVFEEFEDILGVVEYMALSRAIIGTPWRNLRPRFGRLFEYRSIDTTNHVERH